VKGLLLLLSLLPSTLAGQDTALSGTPEPGSELTVYIMTMGPGEQIWERFGHIGIGIRDASTGTDSVYDYGRFSFSQPGFLRRFLQGRMQYWMGGGEASAYLRAYSAARRSVWEQELNLTPSERVALREFLRWNERPENIYYRYDYYRDNCSTRVRDAIDSVLGGAIHRQTDTMATGTTFRSHTQRLAAPDPPMYTGLLAAMGQPIDAPISAWEEMFLPLAVRDHLRSITVPGPGGAPVPLVKAERTLYESEVFVNRVTPPNWVLRFLVIGFAVGLIGLLLAWRGIARRWARTGFALLATLWYLLLGVGGIILLGLWGFTDHWVTYRNENVLQFNLLALPLVVLVPMALRGGEKSGPAALRVVSLVAGVSLVGLLLKLVPTFYQVNLEIIALVLPINLALAAGTYLLVRNRPSVIL
jgi:hypothetical protein